MRRQRQRRTPTQPPRRTDANGDGTPDEIETTITKVEFIERYQSIFDELELTGIDYTATDVLDGEIIATVDYTLTYHSARANEDLTYDFVIEANRIEHRWTINWSPKLIFPEMEWGDSLRVGVLQANRGEILAYGEPYAQNVSAVTVFLRAEYDSECRRVHPLGCRHAGDGDDRRRCAQRVKEGSKTTSSNSRHFIPTRRRLTSSSDCSP